MITDVLVHDEKLPRGVLSRYRAEGGAPVEIDPEEIERLGVRVCVARVLPDEIVAEVRHDPDRLARAVLEIAAQHGVASASPFS